MAIELSQAGEGPSGQDTAVLTAATGAGLGAELSVPQAADITVDHDNVLRAAQVIQNVLDTEGAQIRANLPMLRVIAPGEDQISVQAARAWNEHLVGGADSYTVRVEQYLRNLQQLVDNLIASARTYGYSEDQIADAFRHTS